MANSMIGKLWKGHDGKLKGMRAEEEMQIVEKLIYLQKGRVRAGDQCEAALLWALLFKQASSRGFTTVGRQFSKNGSEE